MPFAKQHQEPVSAWLVKFCFRFHLFQISSTCNSFNSATMQSMITHFINSFFSVGGGLLQSSWVGLIKHMKKIHELQEFKQQTQKFISTTGN